MIKGWMRTTLIDYPGQIASIIFLGGCGFRCPMCHNPELVLHPEKYPEIPVEDVLEFLRQRQGKVTGVVISGGEPCLHSGLPELIRELRELGVNIKLDTCGYYPDMLKKLLDEELLNYVAMDVKAPLSKYSLLAGVKKIDPDRLQSSINLLLNSHISYEFRTTVVPGYLNPQDIAAIAEWIQGAEHYVLQQFRAEICIDPGMQAQKPYPLSSLTEMQQVAAVYIKKVSIRGA